MNQILQTLLPRGEASTRLLLSSFGTSGLLHVIVGAALATWLGAMAPHLFPPRQGFNSIQSTASQAIQLEAVFADAESSQPISLERSSPTGTSESDSASVHRAPMIGAEPELHFVKSAIEASTSSAQPKSATQRGRAELVPRPPTESPVLPRATVPAPPVPTLTSVAAVASQQDAGQLDSIPSAVFSPQPEYPATALENRLEGRVVLRVRIRADGNVATASVLRSSGHSILDEAARRAVLRWRFEPPKRLGIAVRTEIAVPVRFQIESE
ncbi:MAG: TonB family protein [Planctomycetes bacterium]|nr:TonB family protein [Planctomycetota bacterium]